MCTDAVCSDALLQCKVLCGCIWNALLEDTKVFTATFLLLYSLFASLIIIIIIVSIITFSKSMSNLLSGFLSLIKIFHQVQHPIVAAHYPFQCNVFCHSILMFHLCCQSPNFSLSFFTKFVQVPLVLERCILFQFPTSNVFNLSSLATAATATAAAAMHDFSTQICSNSWP